MTIHLPNRLDIHLLTTMTFNPKPLKHKNRCVRVWLQLQTEACFTADWISIHSHGPAYVGEGVGGLRWRNNRDVCTANASYHTGKEQQRQDADARTAPLWLSQSRLLINFQIIDVKVKAAAATVLQISRPPPSTFLSVAAGRADTKSMDLFQQNHRRRHVNFYVKCPPSVALQQQQGKSFLIGCKGAGLIGRTEWRGGVALV